MKDTLLTIFWSQPAKSNGKSKDNSSTCSMGTTSSNTSVQSRRMSVPYNARNDNLPKRSTFRESYSRLRSHNIERRVKTVSTSVPDKSRMRVRHLLHSRKGKSSKASVERQEKSAEDNENIFSYPVAGRTYEMPDEVKDELDVMASNEDGMRLVSVNLY
jgi:hypothetical protein